MLLKTHAYAYVENRKPKDRSYFDAALTNPSCPSEIISESWYEKFVFASVFICFIVLCAHSRAKPMFLETKICRARFPASNRLRSSFTFNSAARANFRSYMISSSAFIRLLLFLPLPSFFIISIAFFGFASKMLKIASEVAIGFSSSLASISSSLVRMVNSSSSSALAMYSNLNNSFTASPNAFSDCASNKTPSSESFSLLSSPLPSFFFLPSLLLFITAKPSFRTPELFLRLRCLRFVFASSSFSSFPTTTSDTDNVFFLGCSLVSAFFFSSTAPPLPPLLLVVVLLLAGGGDAFNNLNAAFKSISS
mmetsp:Transcript_7327/g.24325  ORF Transcript_7327/g.24325 Transcript_7327/m.24325 type:complete len:308 (-) Transcript_7327:161-1084(-)